MNLIKNTILAIILVFSFIFIWWNTQVSADEVVKGNSYLNISTENIDTWTDRNTDLEYFWGVEDEFFWLSSIKWGKGIFYTLVQVAQSLKNLFFILATLFYLIIAMKLIIAENTEEEVWKFKKGIIWITIWLIIMQIAYSFVITLYAQYIWESLAISLTTNIIDPLIWLMEVLASIFFLAIAIFAFYRMITANWKEEEVTRAKMTIVYAIMWFILLKLAKTIVEWVYWKMDCTGLLPEESCLLEAQTSDLASRIIDIIIWANWFIWIITILLIIYAWFNLLFSAGDEEKIKKAKKTILYVIIWLILLVINYSILTFFIIPKSTI